MKNIVISLFGSSIMEGVAGASTPGERWYSVLHRMLSDRFPDICFSIVNAAVGGESTRELMAHVDRDVFSRNPDYCLCMFGWNNDDVLKPGRRVFPDELQELMDEFTKLAQDANCTPIGIVTNPVLEEFHFCSRVPEYKAINDPAGGMDAYHDWERDMSRRHFEAHCWDYVDLYKLMLDRKYDFMLHSDGIHLTVEGHRFFAEKVFECLEKLVA